VKTRTVAAAVLVVTSTMSLRAADTDRFHIALLPTTGLASVVAESGLTPQAASAADHAWIWSDTRPPIRADREQLRSGAWKQALLDTRDDAKVSVRLAEPDGTKQRRPHGRIIAAPVELWAGMAEADLPAYAVDDAGQAVIPTRRGERLRVRYCDATTAGWWVEVKAPGAVTVRLEAATALNIAVIDEQKKGVSDVTAALVPGGMEARAVAQLRGDPRGLLRLTIPRSDRLTVVTNAPGFAPSSFTAAAEDFPAVVLMRHGRRLSGQIVTPKGLPIAGAAVRAEAWVEDTLALFSRTVTSDQAGRWVVTAVPRQAAKVIVSAHGRASVSTTVDGAGDMDLARMELQPAAAVHLKVISASGGEPVAGVTAQLLDGTERTFDGDAEGELFAEGIPANGAARLRLSAGRFLAQTVTVEAGARKKVIELTPGVIVKGRIRGEDGAPLTARLSVESGNRFSSAPVGEDGAFDLLLDPEREYDLRFEPASAAQTTVHLHAERPGAVVDLGDIRPERGIVARGVVLDELGQPLAGAKLWLPRAGAGGTVVSWVNGRIISTVTDADGRYELKGLPFAAALVRVDHPDKARAYVTLDPQQADEVLDVPPIALSNGATIRVLPGGDRDDLSVTLDLRGTWEEPDWLTSPVRDGVATLRHVPKGPAILHVRAGERIVCQRDVEIAGDREIDAGCAAEQVEVTGSVTFGGVPATDGQLVWSSSAASQPAAGIFTTLSPGGAQQQRVVGAGAPRVSVPVSGNGSYRTREIFPGRWTVTWLSSTGISTQPRTVDVPAVKTFEYAMQLPGGRLHGTVVDVEGKPVGRSHVRETGSNASTLTSEDGTFELRGLQPGLNRLQAQAGNQLSRIVAVSIEEERPADPVTLTLAGDGEGVVRVEVTGPAGQPVTGAFVFMESDQLLTAMTNGAGAAEFARPEQAGRFRVAAYAEGRWSLGDWQSSDLRAPVRLTVGEAGRLRVTSSRGGLVGVTAASGWPLSLLMSRVGLMPRLIGGELTVSGVPPGVYAVSLPPNSATVTVARNEAAVVGFD